MGGAEGQTCSGEIRNSGVYTVNHVATWLDVDYAVAEWGVYP